MGSRPRCAAALWVMEPRRRCAAALWPWACGALLACSAHTLNRAPATAKPAQAVSAAQAATAVPADPALALAALLPAGADRCVIARPVLVPPEHRGLIARVSQGEPFAWLAELGLESYATALRERRDGPSARVTLLWLTHVSDDTRALIDARAGVALQWGQAAPCAGASCPARAHVLDAHVIRIERDAFPEPTDPGAEVQCSRLAAHAPGALEVAFARSRRLSADLIGVPLRATSTVTLASHGVHVNRVELMRSMAEAALAQQQGGFVERRGAAWDGLATDLRVEQVDSALHTDFDVQWEDLELALQDDARARNAEREADARASAVLAPDAPFDLSSREAVLAQLAYRQERAEHGDQSERIVQLNAARALLDAACSARPEDEGLALLRAELVIAELKDADASRALTREGAQRFETQARWHALERAAAALRGEAALANALVAQHIADRRAAIAFARDILERVQSGASYDDAERAVLENKNAL